MAETLIGSHDGDLGQLLRLDGKGAVVTGAAQRIGREIARVFAAQGARVLVTDVQDELGERTAAEIRAAGSEASYAHADVSLHADIRSMIETAVRRYGRLDILVNNAHWEKHGTVVDIDEADWDRSFAVLLKALYLGCKYAIPEMRSVGGGSIVNISSVHAFHVSDRYVTYQTAKAAVVQFTRQVAWDFGAERIRCNCICPGDIPIPSDIEARSNEPGFLEERTLLKALKRPGHPRDIAFAALFLVSDLADWITGQALTVDGGEHLTFPIVGAQRWEEFLQQHPGYRLTPLV